MSHISAATQTIGFLLTPNFALMSYASATEPLRAANLLAQSPLYQIVPLSVDGQPVMASCGLAVPCLSLEAWREGAGRQAGLDNSMKDNAGYSRLHSLFVVAGGNPSDWRSASTAYPHLRRLSRQGVRLGGISGGAYLLVDAGLLDQHAFTIHWEYAAALAEAFPMHQPKQARFVLDGERITCGGGVAALDMMHALIAERLGTAFARRVVDWYLHTAVAEPEGPQRSVREERFATRHPALIAVLEAMESTIEHPLTRQAMARLAGVTPRHLDRLFSRHLGTTFLERYRDIRLTHARKLLEQSPLSISEIAFATGFSSASHFSRAFQARFGLQPKRLKAKMA
ncbi:GlxA family transcriptional regulator [Allorhizobium sp. BGMRC 0089]|uniref:GlxA family transcriptional regulator n=1 Tax=Allorhizobium sonneratiae TaxID=2934936 RepID=UPI0020344845|nr:GlxA family transcriptional regulator [Allorhizobium sonneratiae]MCM2292488.1 GlxA family transcriptional regulator [Allorhizobium sonneratiae]